MTKNNHLTGTGASAEDPDETRRLRERIVLLEAELAGSKQQLSELESKCKEQNHLLMVFLDHLPICLYRAKFDGTITYSSGAGHKLLGSGYVDVIGKNSFELYPYCWEMVQQVIKEGIAHQIHHFTVDAKELYFHDTMVKDPMDEAYIGISFDVTDLNHAKKEIERQAAELAEIMAFKDRLFSVISHDLRSPLNNLMSAAQLAEEELISGQEHLEMVRQINLNVKQVRSVLDSILKWSFLQMGQQQDPVKIQMSGFIQEHIDLFALLAFKKQIEIRVDCPENLSVHADADLLSLVLRNFIDNAVKFTPFGGQISIGLKTMAGQQTFFVSNTTEKGIDEETITRILSTRDMQSDYGTDNELGSGYGLQLCKEFISKMNSELKIEGYREGWTTFYFEIKN